MVWPRVPLFLILLLLVLLSLSFRFLLRSLALPFPLELLLFVHGLLLSVFQFNIDQGFDINHSKNAESQLKTISSTLKSSSNVTF